MTEEDIHGGMSYDSWPGDKPDDGSRHNHGSLWGNLRCAFIDLRMWIRSNHPA